MLTYPFSTCHKRSMEKNWIQSQFDPNFTMDGFVHDHQARTQSDSRGLKTSQRLFTPWILARMIFTGPCLALMNPFAAAVQVGCTCFVMLQKHNGWSKWMHASSPKEHLEPNGGNIGSEWLYP